MWFALAARLRMAIVASNLVENTSEALLVESGTAGLAPMKLLLGALVALSCLNSPTTDESYEQIIDYQAIT